MLGPGSEGDGRPASAAVQRLGSSSASLKVDEYLADGGGVGSVVEMG